MLREGLPEDLPVVFMSAVTGKGLTELKDLLWRGLDSEGSKREALAGEDSLGQRDREVGILASDFADWTDDIEPLEDEDDIEELEVYDLEDLEDE